MCVCVCVCVCVFYNSHFVVVVVVVVFLVCIFNTWCLPDSFQNKKQNGRLDECVMQSTFTPSKTRTVILYGSGQV